MFEEEPDVVDLAKDSTAFPVITYYTALTLTNPPISCIGSSNCLTFSRFSHCPPSSTSLQALEPDEGVYEPCRSRLLGRGRGENDLDDEEEDYESSARLLGMSFMNRSSTHNPSSSPYNRQAPPRSFLLFKSNQTVFKVNLNIPVHFTVNEKQT